MSTKPAVKTPCSHCGLDCDTPGITVGDRQFCCTGCRTVFLLLSENGLDGYYQDNTAPGERLRPTATGRDMFAYLDNQDIANRLRQFSDGAISRVTFTLPQIHCASCVWLLERLPQLNPAIRRADVNFPAKELVVVYEEPQLSLRELVELLATLGYEPALKLDSIADDTPQTQSKSARKTLYLKLGIAGFAFGNVMLLSFPEYLSGSTQVEPEIARALGLVSIALSLPVLFYAGIDFLKSALSGLRNRTLNIDVPITLGMLALFARSVYEILSATGAGYLDSFTGLVFFLLLGKLFQEKTYSALSFERDYRSFFPLSALRISGAHSESVALDTLSVGDRIIVRNGEMVPADGILRHGSAALDYSFVTGESEEQVRQPGERVYAGARQCGGAIEIELTRDVSQSYLVRLWSSGAVKNATQSAMTTMIDTAAGYFTPVALGIAVVAFIYWLPSGVGVATNVATATLLVVCPCALALTAPFAFGTGMRLLERIRVFVKNAPALERISRITHIVFDKTGTLTTGSEAIYQSADEGVELSAYQQALVRSLAQQSAHPASRAIARQFSGAVTFDVCDYQEIVGAGISATVDGRHVRIGSQSFTGANETDIAGDVYLSIDSQCPGAFVLPARLRPGLKKTVGALRSRFALSLLSGDSDRQRQLMKQVFAEDESCVFSASPEEKMEHIATLRDEGAKTMMVGDGLNDAGALSAADVGVALNERQGGLSPAADVIMESSALKKLPEIMAFAKKIRKVIYVGFAISLLYNIVGVTFAVSGALTPAIAALLMPLSSITVVAFAVALTYLQAKRSGVVELR